MDTLQYAESSRRWLKLGAAALALLLLGWLVALLLRPQQATPARAQPPRITQVMLPPPPPPPPPPKPEPEPPKPQERPQPLQAAEPMPQPKPDTEPTPPGDPLTAPAGPGDARGR